MCKCIYKLTFGIFKSKDLGLTNMFADGQTDKIICRGCFTPKNNYRTSKILFDNPW